MKALKRAIKKTWMGRMLIRMRPAKKPHSDFPGSKQYWEQRYQDNRNSGAGSYGRLATFKARILNDFVRDQQIKTVIEMGSGDGHQLSLAEYPHYIGYDVSKKAVELCQQQFAQDDSKEFYWMGASGFSLQRAELTLSLDVIYHLIEDEVFHQYMTDLFAASTRFVIIYSSNKDEVIAAHVRSRKFTDWVDQHLDSHWTLMQHIENEYPFDPADPDHTSIANFYIYQQIEG